MVSPFLHSQFVETRRFPISIEPERNEVFPLGAPGIGETRLHLRPARVGDGDALQAYVRSLSVQSRYNRFLGAVNELSGPELARILAANGRDTLTLLLVSRKDDRETIVGEARAALSCAERAGEFSLSIGDDWRGFGIGSGLLEEIERRAAADGIERLFGDVLRTNAAMVALARRLGFRVGPGIEPRLVRVEKRLNAAPDPPCLKWAEISRGGVPGVVRGL